MLQPLPIGQSSFANIRTSQQLYIDKTELIFNMVQWGSFYFLSRPRRFGKSLLLSTLHELFAGNQKLFTGLWVENKWDWQEHAVLEISFAGVDYQRLGLEEALCKKLNKIAVEQFEIKLKEPTAKLKFQELIRKIDRGNGVVILIDEYDKPINDFLTDIKLAKQNRDILRNFFGSLKANDVISHIRFLLITGVSKFSKVSLFSELNNLTDLTNYPAFSTLLGVTSTELERYFKNYIQRYANNHNLSEKHVLQEIRKWYNGYSWDAKNFVYNPYSLFNFFLQQRFDNYWFASGTSQWLVEQIRIQQIDLNKLEKQRVGSEFFAAFELDYIDPIVILFQTGYLTIKQIKGRPGRERYFLDYPNLEVKQSMLKNLFHVYAEQRTGKVSDTIWNLQESLENNKLDQFIQQFRAIFADISNRLLKQYIETDDLKLWEAYYQTVIYLALELIGMDVKHEVQTNRGYIDCVVEVDDYVYVMEFKMGSAESALQQIRERGYADKYVATGKEIILVGIGFDAEVRNIDKYLVAS